MNENFNLFLLFILWNTICYFAMGLDKKNARLNRHRIPEKKLLIMAFFMGGLGILTGMRVFRHKTKHFRFTILVPLFSALNFVLIVMYVTYIYFSV